jgi:muramoyltetrapeptide carboxypeptidase LdcA involved in peptidoglycan recycling
MSSSTIIALKTLTKYVAAQLEERAFCVVFENDLEHCWARKDTTRAKRERDIQSFAESQGWTAAIVEGGFGTRAIFRKLEPTSAF